MQTSQPLIISGRNSDRGPSAPREVTLAIPGHFGELLQGRLGDGGPVALVTLPLSAPVVTLSFQPRGEFDCTDPLVRRAGLAAFEGLGRAPQGTLSFERFGPSGGGAGASTASILAAIRAIRTAFGAEALSAEAESALLLGIEGAVDPLAYPADPPMLWAPREARTLKILPSLPSLRIIGGFDGPGRRTDALDQDFPDISEDAAALERALDAKDAAALGRIASRSAAANQSRNPKPHWHEITDFAARTGALGVAAAHTGAALAVLYGPGDDAPSPSALAELGPSDCIEWRI